MPSNYHWDLARVDPHVLIRILNDQLTIVIVHVDDLILLTKTEEDMISVKTSLGKPFQNEEDR
jgi:hypothetical protein